jgi:uncharacterized membrane protein
MNAPTHAPSTNRPNSLHPNPALGKSELKITDYSIEVILGYVLRAGVILSAAIVLTGATIFIIRHGHDPANYRIFRGEPSDYRTIPGVVRNALRGRGRGLIQLGLLVLIATPIARVVFSVAGFVLERDRLYVVFTLIVLTVLLYSLLGSGLGL